MTWDAIVVGARCAGAPLARFLARAGKKVLVVDAAQMPSAPPVMTFAQRVGPHTVKLRLPLGGCCPRRTDLDAPFFRAGRRGAAIKKELARRRALLTPALPA